MQKILIFGNFLITKLSNIACVIQCGGIWFANGKFGVTWRLVQAVVKPQETFKGKCHLFLSESDKERMVGSSPVEKQDNITVDVEEENDEVEKKCDMRTMMMIMNDVE